VSESASGSQPNRRDGVACVLSAIRVHELSDTPPDVRRSATGEMELKVQVSAAGVGIVTATNDAGATQRRSRLRSGRSRALEVCLPPQRPWKERACRQRRNVFI
jgi:hypothetical protein